MVYMRDIFRPKALYSVYPPYHTGEYQEEYFYRRWYESNIKSDRKYIDIFWTNLYCNASQLNINPPNIQEELNNTLDWNGKYFTICQHDDGPFEELPPDTVFFVSGGNKNFTKKVALPSICSKIPIINYVENNHRPLLASFVGSNTHPVRQEMFRACYNHPKIKIQIKQWNPVVSSDDFNLFANLAYQSKFTLSPRGYGRSSFRMYEAMQLGSIPVYIFDEPYLPWEDELNYSEFCVLIDKPKIPDIVSILESYSEEDLIKMREKMKQVWESHFSLEGMFQQVVKRLPNYS